MMRDTDAQLQGSFDRDAVRNAVIRMGEAIDGTMSNDPVDNPEVEAAMLALADLLANVPSRNAAEGVQSALSELLIRWIMRG